VLRNRYGITEEQALEKAEASAVAIRSLALVRKPLKGAFDLAHLQAIHRYLFQDVYDWAGQLRTVDMTKGATRFAHFGHIAGAAADVFTKLAKEQCLRGLNADEFSHRAAFYLGELNALHPFREGNGRTQRAFLLHVAFACGYYVAWEKMDREALLAASIASFNGKLEPLAALIRRGLSDAST